MTTASNLAGPSKLRYRPDIDGLRALAIISVIAYHAGFAVISGGFVGVDVFFVISGYLIGGILFREVSESRFSVAKFYVRRARRILPALFALLLISITIALFLLSPPELIHFAEGAISSTLAVSNIVFWLGTNYFSPAAELNPLLMTWSLGVEEQFYVFLPAVMLLTMKAWPRRITVIIGAISALSFVLSVCLTTKYPTAAFFLLPTRAWELGIGTLLAIVEIRYDLLESLSQSRIVRNATSVIGLFLVAASFLMINATASFPGYLAAVPVIGTALLIASRDSIINRLLLSWPPLVFIGRISYSWYLWHWPLLSFARISASGRLDLEQSILIVSLSFFAAVLSWRFIEQPFRKIRKPGLSTLRGYGSAAAIVTIASLLLFVNHGLQRRFSPELTAIDRSTASLAKDKCLAGYGIVAVNMSADCVAQSEHRGVALVGDSHAAALAGALRDLASQNGFSFSQLTKSSCPALDGVTRRMLNHPMHESECATYNRHALDFVQRKPSITVVILAGYWAAPFDEEASGSRYATTSQYRMNVSETQSRENLREGLFKTINMLQSEHKKVILLSDVPMFSFDPLYYGESLHIPTRKLLQSLLSGHMQIIPFSAPLSDLEHVQDQSADIIHLVAARFPHVESIDLRNAFCKAQRCTFGDDSGLYYVDNQHLSLHGAQYALRSSNLLL